MEEDIGRPDDMRTQAQKTTLEGDTGAVQKNIAREEGNLLVRRTQELHGTRASPLDLTPSPSMAADVGRLAQKLAVRWFRGEETRSAVSVIGFEHGAGRTTLATTLARLYASAGVSTLLIDADHHNPDVHGQFGLQFDDYGDDGRLPISMQNLAIISAAKLFSISFGKLMPTAMESLVKQNQADYDVILVDTTAACSSDDYLFAAKATQGAIFVSRDGKTRVRSAAKMLNVCESAGVKVIGGVMLRH